MNAIMEYILEIVLIAICLGAGIWSWWMDNGPVKEDKTKEQTDPDAEGEGENAEGEDAEGIKGNDYDDHAKEEKDT